MIKKFAEFLRSDIGTIILAVVTVSPALWWLYQPVAKFLPFAWRLTLDGRWREQIPALVLCALFDLGIIVWAIAKQQRVTLNWLALPSLVAMAAL